MPARQPIALVLAATTVLALSAVSAARHPAAAQGIDLSELNNIVNQATNELAVQINLSGRQRMLTQKMSKEALLLALGVEPAKTRLKMLKTALLFDRTLKGLMHGDKEQNLPPTKQKDILEQLAKVQGLWKEFLPLIIRLGKAKTVERGIIEQIARKNLPLLAEMNKAVKMYEQASGADTAELAVVINLSGRQRMLTQRMAKEYLLAAYGIEPEKNRARMQKTMELFDRTLKGLLDGDEKQGLPGTKDPAIRAQLKKVMDLWAQYRPMLQTPPDKADLKALEDMSLKILAEMNRAVKMYEESW